MQPPQQSPQSIESSAQPPLQQPSTGTGVRSDPGHVSTQPPVQQFPEQTATQPAAGQQPAQHATMAQQPAMAQQQPSQYGGQAETAGQGLRLQDVETPQQRAVVDIVARSQQVCEWCADQCIQLGDERMVECIRLDEDVAELSETVLAFVPRNSRFSRRVLQSFVQAARACRQECSTHSHAHCQECAQVLSEAINTVEQYLATMQQGRPIQQGI